MSAEAKKKEVKPLTEDQQEKLADTVIDYCAGAAAIIGVMKGSDVIRSPEIAMGAIYMALKSLYVDFPEKGTRFASIIQLIDHVMQGENGKELLRRVAEAVKEVPVAMEVVDAMVILPRFRLGRVNISESCKRAVPPERLGHCLNMHGNGEWGPFLDDGTKRDNTENMQKKEGKILSIYRIDDSKQDNNIDNKLYIITEADRSATAVILPRDQ